MNGVNADRNNVSSEALGLLLELQESRLNLVRSGSHLRSHSLWLLPWSLLRFGVGFLRLRAANAKARRYFEKGALPQGEGA